MIGGTGRFPSKVKDTSRADQIGDEKRVEAKFQVRWSSISFHCIEFSSHRKTFHDSRKCERICSTSTSVDRSRSLMTWSKLCSFLTELERKKAISISAWKSSSTTICSSTMSNRERPTLANRSLKYQLTNRSQISNIGLKLQRGVSVAVNEFLYTPNSYFPSRWLWLEMKNPCHFSTASQSWWRKEDFSSVFKSRTMMDLREHEAELPLVLLSCQMRK